KFGAVQAKRYGVRRSSALTLLRASDRDRAGQSAGEIEKQQRPDLRKVGRVDLQPAGQALGGAVQVGDRQPALDAVGTNGKPQCLRVEAVVGPGEIDSAIDRPACEAPRK